MSLPSEAQKPNPSAQIALYRFDATVIDGPVLFFTQSVKVNPDGVNTAVSFGGQAFQPADIEFSGFEVNAGGALPQPTLRVSNADSLDNNGNVGMIQGMVNGFGDLLGCELRRIRTFKRFLDGEPDADGTAFIGPDVFSLERKVTENAIYIEWQLSASIDQAGKMIPGRQVLRDTCIKRYRFFKGDAFVTPTVNPCPYTGTDMFTIVGQTTTDPTKDVCGRHLSDCELRFGKGNPLPFGGFPGVTRVRL